MAARIESPDLVLRQAQDEVLRGIRDEVLRGLMPSGFQGSAPSVDLIVSLSNHEVVARAVGSC
jgi:hypothetical protein